MASISSVVSKTNAAAQAHPLGGGSNINVNSNQTSSLYPNHTTYLDSSPSVGNSYYDSYAPSGGSSVSSTNLFPFLNVLGGYMQHQSQNRQNKIAQEQFNRNFEYQRYANENAIQIRVNDAMKAGLHPLAALGISAHASASPSTAHHTPATGMGAGLMQAAQAALSGKQVDGIQQGIDESRTRMLVNQAMAMHHVASATREYSSASLNNRIDRNYNLYRSIDSGANLLRSIGQAITGGSNLSRSIDYSDFLSNKNDIYKNWLYDR